jgi:DNA-binding LacI/PurR family transcriptional regulator
MAKHQQIQEALTEGIRSGEFPPDSRLPSEREIAQRFGVSYLTARHAVAQLVEANLLERRARSGTYVRQNSFRKLATRTYHLICTAEDHSLARAFLRIGARLIGERGGRPDILRLHDGEERNALRALQSGDPSLVMTDFLDRQNPLVLAMQRAEGRAVLVANRMDDLGIPSVLADDTQALRLAITHLQDRGHRRIALLCDHPSHPVARVQVAAWRAWCSPAMIPGEEPSQTIDQRLIAVRTANFGCLRTSAYDAFSEFLNSERAEGVTAVISLIDEMVSPALAAARDAGWAVPERLSVVSLGGDNSLFAFAHPPVTSVDVDIEGHITEALDLIDAAESGRRNPDDCLRLIEPCLIERRSVQSL